LSEIQKIITTQGKSAPASSYLALSSKFFTIIPHDFGVKNAPIIDNEDLIKEKNQLLEALLDMEITTSLLKSGEGEETDQITANYNKLNTELNPVEKSSTEFNIVENFIKNTHAATHADYHLELLDLFTVERAGEENRFTPSRKLHNHMLLWHGSRLTNFAGILSQGLRIAPPEAPVTGYMFGKGVYFADMVSKSANYCRTSRDSPTGIMLLSDVALGDMYELLHAQYMDVSPKGTHSTKGCGKTIPDPSEQIYMEEGKLAVPIGKGINGGNLYPKLKNSQLLYNEFIVYDIAQIKIKYLLKLKFHYH